jgi:predicted nucleotidyltransferase
MQEGVHQQAALQRLADLAAGNSAVDVLWLYGSRAKGTWSSGSDFDLAVAFRDMPSEGLERRLRPELLAQDWAGALGLGDTQLSVADINQVPVPLAYAIVTTGQVLFVRSGLRLAREENRATSMWELDHQYHRRFYG